MMTHPATPAMPPRPQANQDLQAFFALTQDVDCSPREWLRVVDRLPQLRQQVLQVINARRAMVQQPITSLPQAIVNIGFNTIRNLAGQLAR